MERSLDCLPLKALNEDGSKAARCIYNSGEAGQVCVAFSQLRRYIGDEALSLCASSPTIKG